MSTIIIAKERKGRVPRGTETDLAYLSQEITFTTFYPSKTGHGTSPIQKEVTTKGHKHGEAWFLVAVFGYYLSQDCHKLFRSVAGKMNDYFHS